MRSEVGRGREEREGDEGDERHEGEENEKACETQDEGGKIARTRKDEL